MNDKYIKIVAGTVSVVIIGEVIIGHPQIPHLLHQDHTQSYFRPVAMGAMDTSSVVSGIFYK